MKQGMWAHDFCLLFQSFRTHNFLSQHYMVMTISALTTNLLGIMMNEHILFQGVVCTHMPCLCRPGHICGWRHEETACDNEITCFSSAAGIKTFWSPCKLIIQINRPHHNILVHVPTHYCNGDTTLAVFISVLAFISSNNNCEAL